MQLTEQALVLRTTKYGDKGLIFQLYGIELGSFSAINRGFYAAKKRNASAATPLSLVEFQLHKNPKSDLFVVGSLKANPKLNWLAVHPYKQSVVFFLSEILAQVIQEQESNPDLFKFLSNALESFCSQKDFNPNFTLIFLLELTYYLGAYPELNDEMGLFDLVEGRFVGQHEGAERLTKSETSLWLRLIKEKNPAFTSSERKVLLNIVLRYYQIHLPGFRTPKSLAVFQQVFA